MIFWIKMIEQHARNFFAGLSGLALPVPKYKFPLEYQNTSRLTYYGALFNSIEVNRSFYKIPLKTTMAKWAASVSDNFKFTFKLFKGITHEKNLDYDNSHIRQFMEALTSIDSKKGCILIQFPPSLKNDNIHQLDDLLKTVRSFDLEQTWTIAVEFRNSGWYHHEVYNVLDANRSTMVFHDMPTSATPLVNQSSQVIYVRFHGPTGNYRGTYTDDFLIEYSEYIKTWLAESKTVYVYFNNTMGNAFQNLVTLKKFVF